MLQLASSLYSGNSIKHCRNTARDPTHPRSVFINFMAKIVPNVLIYKTNCYHKEVLQRQLNK
jgi:hypothetical protein